jgi:hypothetical protein
MQDNTIIDLDKRVEDIEIILEKHGIKTVAPTRVGLALDVSGSAQGLYHSGVMENTVARCLAVAAKFDDNGEMDMWAFSEGFEQLPSATAQDYGTYVRKKLLRSEKNLYWNGTLYSPVMRSIDEFYFPQRPRAAAKTGSFLGKLFGRQAPQPQGDTNTGLLPAHVMFITDGEDDRGDMAEVVELLEQTQALPVYWNMIGVGPAHRFGFIESLADRFDHVGFVNLADLSVSDDELYDQILGDEFVGWIKRLSA